MNDDRDITERLDDPAYDGALFMRQEAAKDIRALRHYVARLEDELARMEVKYKRLNGWSQAEIKRLNAENARLQGDRKVPPPSECADEIERLDAEADHWLQQWSTAVTERQMWQVKAEAMLAENARLRDALEETFAIAVRNETGPWVARARTALAEQEPK